MDNENQRIEHEVTDSGGNYENSIRSHYKKPLQNFRRYSSWQRNPSRRVEDDHMPNIGMGRIWGRVLDRAFDNSDRRQYGMGFIGRLCRYFYFIYLFILIKTVFIVYSYYNEIFFLDVL